MKAKKHTQFHIYRHQNRFPDAHFQNPIESYRLQNSLNADPQERSTGIHYRPFPELNYQKPHKMQYDKNYTNEKLECTCIGIHFLPTP